MKKTFINAYIKYTARTPVLFFLMVVFCILLIVFLTTTTTLNHMETYDAVVMDHNKVRIDDTIAPLDRVYLYTQRDQDMVSCHVQRVDYHEDQTDIILMDGVDIAFPPGSDVFVELAQTTTTLWERIFVKGGRLLGQ